MKNLLIGIVLGIVPSLVYCSLYTTAIRSHYRQMQVDTEAKYVELINSQKATIDKQDEALATQKAEMETAKKNMVKATKVMIIADGTIEHQSTVLQQCMGTLKLYANELSNRH